MTPSKIHILAQTIIALTIAGLLYLGFQMLSVPKIFLLVQRPYPILAYEGPILVAMAVGLAWFREWLAHRLVWIFMEIHRLISALLIMAVVGAEGFMHAFNIPHLEGWWIPLVGGGAAATAITSWLRKWKKKSSSSSAQ